MAATILLEIIKIRQDTDDTKTFFLEQLNGKKIVYQAGQFLTFIFPRNGREIRRSYSISSSPDTGEQLSITVRKEENGVMSRHMVDFAKEGDAFEALHPSGMFIIPYQQSTPRDIFLIAAGTGITPVYSLLKSLLLKEPASRVTLLYSNHDESRAIFYDELKALSKSHPQQLEIEFLFSNHRNVLKARLSSSSLEILLRQHLHFPKEKALVYTCGPFGFMQTVQIVALSHGFNKENIRKEIFTDVVKIAARQYFDHTDRQVTLQYNNATHKILIPYNKTILQSALDHRIDLPYSCRAGRCSACRAKLVSGKVWMHYNEVLTDKDETEGWVLTCTGHPMSGDVIIQVI